MVDETEIQNPGDSSAENSSGAQESVQENSTEAAEAASFPDFSQETSRETIGSFADERTLGSNGDVTAVYNVPVQVSAVLGRATMPVSQLLKLGRGAVVELDRRVGESIDIFVNNRLIARGEVVVIEERLGITMTEIIKGDS